MHLLVFMRVITQVDFIKHFLHKQWATILGVILLF